MKMNDFEYYLICDLVRAIETWAADEDCVDPDVWETTWNTYYRAKALIKVEETEREAHNA